MKIYITTCCKNKSKNIDKIPSIERYKSNRIKYVYKLSKKDNARFFILSGKFGLLSPTDKIYWYDKILLKNEIDKITELVSQQLNEINPSEIIFFYKQDWITYAKVISKASNNINLKLKKLK